jgi:hypothetical protein|tara:strand:+ start:50 stop:484 length:435 start_codon:yes stop_codon:yes gene_type:complete
MPYSDEFEDVVSGQVSGLLGNSGNQVDLSKLGLIAKTGLTGGISKALWGVHPILGVAANIPGSFITTGAKKLGQATGLLPGDKLWGQLTANEKIAAAQEKFGLLEDFYGGTGSPLSGFVSRFVDLLSGGATKYNDPDKDWTLLP